jgi:anthranilate phosphoribosyltransferase
MPSKKSDWHLSAPLSATSARADTPLFPFLARLMRGEDLSIGEAEKFFHALTEPSIGSNQIAAALAVLTAKGETDDEIAGMASVMRQLSIRVKAPKNAVDIAGTGASSARTFSVSTAAAIVAAGAGVTIAKQSNRGSAKAGSLDTLNELGIAAAEDQQRAQSCLAGVGCAFFAAPKFHPALRRIADVRGRLGIRTCLSVLGLLANPAWPARQVIGVWHKSLVEPVARALAHLKAENAWVVHGTDGLDEITLDGKTLVGAVSNSQVKAMVLSPADFGLKDGSLAGIKGKSAKEGAQIIREVLTSRRRDEARSLIVINAAAAIYISGLAKDPIQAARLAEQSIDSGMAQNKLDRLMQLTKKK